LAKVFKMKTKIVATIGPACKDRVTLENMVEAGLDVARLNFSHGKKSEFAAWIKIFREISKEKQQAIAIIQDLQGPRIRVGELNKPIKLKKDQVVKLAVKPKVFKNTAKEPTIPLVYKTLNQDIKENDRILIDNGKIELKVLSVERKQIKAKVIIGGEIISHKGINLPDTKISLPNITKKDKEDLKFGIEHKVDFITLSFIRTANDIKAGRKLVEQTGGKDIQIIAKIETKEALNNISDIIEQADAIMIGRGDLGIELPIEEIPIAQKKIIRLCREAGKPVITATQMLSSMENNPKPTRAEVSDVANAILDGSDAVMLSEETAMGKYPVETVKQMDRIIQRNEKELKGKDYGLINIKDETKAVGDSACEMAYQLNAKFIVCATASGFTANMVSLHRPKTPIIAFTPSKKVYNQLALVWGVIPQMLPTFHTTDEFIFQIVNRLKTNGKVKKSDLIIVTAGHPIGKKGNTNLIKVQKID